MNKEEATYKDDEEMEAIIKKKQRLINVLNICMWILLATLLLPFVGALLDIYDTTILTVLRAIPVAGIAVGFALAMYCNKKLKELKELTGRYIVQGVLREKLQVLDYRPNSYTDEAFLKNCSILPNYNRLSGSDYIHGVYRNVEFTYSDIELKWESQDYTADSSSMKTTITEFKGPFITMSLKNGLDGFVQIQERRGSGQKTKKYKNFRVGDDSDNASDWLKSGDHVFDERFAVSASDEALAYSVLTPAFTSGLKRFDKYTGVQIYRNMAVIACSNEKNLFEIDKQIKKQEDIELYRQKFRQELDGVLSMLDVIIDGCRG